MGTPGDGGNGKRKERLWRCFGKKGENGRRRWRHQRLRERGKAAARSAGRRRRWVGEKFVLSRGLNMKMMINEEKSVFKLRVYVRISNHEISKFSEDYTAVLNRFT